MDVYPTDGRLIHNRLFVVVELLEFLCVLHHDQVLPIQVLINLALCLALEALVCLVLAPLQRQDESRARLAVIVAKHTDVLIVYAFERGQVTTKLVFLIERIERLIGLTFKFIKLFCFTRVNHVSLSAVA